MTKKSRITAGTESVTIVRACQLNNMYVYAKTEGGQVTSEAACTESTNGNPIQIDPEKSMCLNSGCRFYVASERR